MHFWFYFSQVSKNKYYTSTKEDAVPALAHFVLIRSYFQRVHIFLEQSFGYADTYLPTPAVLSQASQV